MLVSTTVTPRALLSSLPLALTLLASACSVSVSSGSGSSDPKPNSGEQVDNDDAKPDSGGDEGDSGGDEGSDTPELTAANALEDCPSEAGRDQLTNYCTDAGKLAGQWVPVDMLKVPADAEIVFHHKPEGVKEAPELSVALVGQRLYIRQVTCGACRRVLGQGFAGHLAHLSEEQMRAVQAQLGLSEDMPLLNTPDQWRSFASDERGKGALTEIAGKTEGETGGR